jgi:hypothetical protein
MAYTTIKKPSDYFNTKLYTGNGTGQSITGVNFQPDFVWTKRRNTIGQHFLQNIVQGTNKALFSDSTSAEFTGGVDGGTSVTSFDSDGFTLGTEGGINGNNDTFVSWNWLANGTGVSNTDGSITSTVSANTTSGFSIVSYTGDGSSTGSNVVGHGLGTTPSMIIIKARAGTNAVNGWYIFHKGLSANNNIRFDTGAQLTTSSFSSGIINTSPTSTTFGFDSGTSLLNINESGTTYIAYCFADVQGFSKFGSYEGNGNVDGPFIYCGFKPAFVLIKKYSAANDWYTHDNKRDTFNPETRYLQPNTSAVETNDTGKALDFLSNGFKLRTTHGSHNGATGQFFIYMAFAENPLVGTNNTPATAR